MEVLRMCNLSEVIVGLKDGKTLIYPTETSYGLGCDASNQSAVDAIFTIKQRDENKPLLVVVSAVEMAKKILVWNNTIEKLSQMFWPGPLTIVGNAQPDCGLARGVVSKSGTVAVRVSADQTVQFLVDSIGKPVVATSGNISSKGDLYSADQVMQMFAGAAHQPDMLLSVGEIARNLPTTIVDASHDTINIIRQGAVTITDV